MWSIEAKTFGNDPNYFRMYGLTETAAHKLQEEMYKSGEWSCVCAWDAETAQKEADSLVDDYFQTLEDGTGEGQPL